MKKLWISLGVLALIIGFACVFFFVLFPIKEKRYIEEICIKYNLELSLVLSIINIESGWDEKALSSSGAVGLMQVMPATAKEVAEKLSLTDYSDDGLYNRKTNIEIGCFYFRYLLDNFDNDENLALCAYNAGPNTIRSWQENNEYWDGEKLIKIPYPETEKYVKKAKTNKKIYNFILQL